MVHHSYSTFRIGLCRYLHAVRQAERYIIVIQLETLVLIQLSGFDLCHSNSKGKRLVNFFSQLVTSLYGYMVGYKKDRTIHCLNRLFHSLKTCRERLETDLYIVV